MRRRLHRFAGPAYAQPVVTTGKLDAFTSGLWGAWGLDRLIGGYSSSALSLRNVDTAAIADIGLSGGSVAGADVLAVAANAAVGRLWDQSGNAHHFEQTGASLQPLVASGGSFLDTVRFDGTDDWMQSTVMSSLTVTAMTVAFKVNRRNTDNHILLEYSPAYHASNACVVYFPDPTSFVAGIADAGNSSTNTFAYGIAPGNSFVAVVKFTRSSGSQSAKARVWINGTELSPTSAGIIPSGFFDPYPFYLGDRSGGGVWPMDMDLRNLAIWTVGLSDSQCVAVSAALT